MLCVFAARLWLCAEEFQLCSLDRDNIDCLLKVKPWVWVEISLKEEFKLRLLGSDHS